MKGSFYTVKPRKLRNMKTTLKQYWSICNVVKNKISLLLSCIVRPVHWTIESHNSSAQILFQSCLVITKVRCLWNDQWSHLKLELLCYKSWSIHYPLSIIIIIHWSPLMQTYGRIYNLISLSHDGYTLHGMTLIEGSSIDLQI